MNSPFAFRGPIESLDTGQRARLLDRAQDQDTAAEPAVREIIRDVRARGDDALRELAARFDGATLDALEVPRSELQRALDNLDADVRAALVQAATNIARFHHAQLPEPLEIETAPGVRLGRRAEALRSVGVYAPGGRATYPSSVLMGVVPARVAGVGEIIVCSPPGPGGLPSDAVLAACAVAGADRVFAIGGAGAIAALALGTDTVPRVDKIVGPGNAFVTEAKRQLNGVVAIDSPAGPSEILIIADDTANATLIASELIAQAEHDPDAACALVALSATLLDDVAAEIDRLSTTQPRRQIIAQALATRGALLSAPSLDVALRFAEDYAPEHLLLLTREPRALLTRVRAAGTVFLGSSSSVAFGDYITGANHVLPTAGLARSYSGLSTLDFMRWSTWQELTPAAAAALSAPTVTLANAEGLPAHALAAQLRAGEITDLPAVHTAVTLRAVYRDIETYDPGRLPSATDLSDNTNLFGPAPAVRRALETLPDVGITRYPDVYAAALKRALAALNDVEPENIATGCGSDDVIDSALRAFCDTDATVAYPDPTFGMVPVFARMNAARPHGVPLRTDFELDPDALLATRATVTYLCRPNNPTGTLFERSATDRVCAHASGIVLVDEAYADFADDNMAAAAVTSDRTIVLRTLSKAWGLAGLRVGYAIGPAPLIAEIEKARGPYKVSGAAEAAALAALTNDRDWVRDRVNDVRTNRTRLRAELAARGVRTWDSSANFVLVSVRGPVSAWNRELRARGVAVRPFAALAGAGDCLRVSVGPWQQLQLFLNAFDDVLVLSREWSA